jgi:hypothetical protein
LGASKISKEKSVISKSKKIFFYQQPACADKYFYENLFALCN